MQDRHHWVKIYKNPNGKNPGYILLNLYDVMAVNVIQNPGEDKPIAVQVATENAQYNVDGCGADQFFEAWQLFQAQTAPTSQCREFSYIGNAPETSPIIRAGLSAVPEVETLGQN